jgi:general secretion pathway protein I
MRAAACHHALRGFTLIEVLIALLILAIALAASARATHLALDSAVEVRQRTLAAWVAENHAAELQARGAFPPPGDTRIDVEMMSQRFIVRQTVSQTPNAAFRRVRLDVFGEGGAAAAAGLTTFLANTETP